MGSVKTYNRNLGKILTTVILTFLFVVPSITSITPTSANTDVGTITIAGTNFEQGSGYCAVQFGEDLMEACYAPFGVRCHF